MRRSPLLAAALALAATATATAAAPAAAPADAWTAPQTVSAPHTFVGPLLTSPVAGSGLVASWEWQDNVGGDARGGAATAARPGGFGTEFGPERPAPDGLAAIGPFANTQTIGLAAQGTPGRSGPTGAILYRLKVAFGPAAGGFGTARTLATVPLIGRPQLASARGSSTALIAWVEIIRTRAGAIRRVVRAIDRRDGRFGAPYTLSGTGRADGLTAAANAQGDQVVAFVRDGDVLARVRRHGHGWGGLRRLARATTTTTWQLASGVNFHGQVRVVWRRHRLRREDAPTRTSLETSALLVGRSAFTPAQTLVQDGASSFRLAEIPDGWAVAYVETTQQGPRPAVLRAVAGSRFGPVLYAAPPQGGIRGADVVSTTRGALVAGWVQPLAGQGGDGIARAAAIAPGQDAFGAVEDVSPPEAVHEVRLASDPRTGQAVAVWTARPEGTGPSIPVDQIRSVVRSAARVP